MLIHLLLHYKYEYSKRYLATGTIFDNKQGKEMRRCHPLSLLSTSMAVLVDDGAGIDW